MTCKACNIEFETTAKCKGLCKSCITKTYTKIVVCEKCGEERKVNKYKTYHTCNKCINVGRKHSEETNRKNTERNTGAGNGMYGKNHSSETKAKLGKYIKSAEQIQKAKENLALNYNKRPIYEIWVEKYGEDGANEKLQKFKEKQSVNNTGVKNAMYGKPSPTGSGNGWSGWYKEHYFRSLMELSYLNYLYLNNIPFSSGEFEKFAIPYVMNNIIYNYFCDFYLINEDCFVEVKPKNLINTVKNKLKFDSAKEKLGSRFMIITEDDINQLTNKEIYDMYNSGDLKWLPRYEEKYKQRYGGNNDKSSGVV